MKGSRQEELRTILQSAYRLIESSIPACGGEILLTGVEDMDELIDRITPEEFAVDERLPYWAIPWRSAAALCSYICDHPGEVAGKEILEIGCGLGLTGIAAARGGGSVTFSDYEPDALLFAEYNFLRNVNFEQRECAFFLPLDWRNPPPRQWDVLLAADILYEERSIEPLLMFVDQALRPGGVLLVAEPNRLVAEPFFLRLHENGYRMDLMQMKVGWEGANAEIALHRIQWERSGN